MQYDQLDRMTNLAEPFGVSLSIGLDAVDNRTSVQDSLGGLTTSAYDPVHNLMSRQFVQSGNQTPLRIDLSYNGRNQVVGMKRYATLSPTSSTPYINTAWAYDSVGRVTSILHTSVSSSGNSTTLQNFTTTYDIAGRARGGWKTAAP
jgi:hypothetical protein